MTNSYSPALDTLDSITLWFRKAKPEFTHKDFQVQLGVHFEEISEMCDELTGVDPETATLIAIVRENAHILANRLKTCGEETRVRIEPDNRKDFLDSICDQIVTATGSAVFANMRVGGAVVEVDQSNWSKFVDGEPIFDENGKIAKGPHYFKADLSPFI